MVTQDLLTIGLTQSLEIFQDIDIKRFHSSLKLLNANGISNRTIARVVGHDEWSIRRWKRGLIPMDKTVIIVVNRWAQALKEQS